MMSTNALEKLIKGNDRFVNGNMKRLNIDKESRIKGLKGQEPFALVLSCSDSRVPPEIIFDQGLGDLFVVRVAGNIIDKTVLGSIEYAVKHLNIKLVMVLGHSNCGAVKAALEGYEEKNNIKIIADKIKPALVDIKESNKALEEAIKFNVKLVVEKLKKSEPVISKLAREDLEILGGFYNIDSGRVDILE
ncbi:MAG: carbonic anhydrase [Firmicutes bacterium]|nr:carbonic anhydrase [Bacillota bacterium]